MARNRRTSRDPERAAAATAPTPAAATASTASVIATMLGLLIAVVVLAFHARSYSFLTDDAFISFRYARNLSHGAGLVFNPGEPAVEGYSNFLWVLVLAGLDRLGLAPESVANALGSACTIGLWLLIVAFCWRRAGRGRECSRARAASRCGRRAGSRRASSSCW